MPENRGPRIFLADLLVEHFEELVFLSGERQEALRSPLYTAFNFDHVRERVAAHIDGLAVAGERSWPLLEAGLGEAEKAFAAARVLLELRDAKASQAVLAALEKAEEEPLAAGLVRALCHGPLELVLKDLQAWFEAGPPRPAAAAAEVLAYRRVLDSRAERLTQLLDDADPLVRRAAWRAAALAG